MADLLAGYINQAMPHEFELAGGRKLTLCHPTESDVARLFEAADTSRNELAPWMTWCHEQFCIVDAETWIRNTTAAENEHAFIIVDEQQGLCLGTCGLNAIDPKNRVANLGYWTRTSHAGLGIAPAATLKVAEIAFNVLELVRVEIIAAIGNTKSQRVAEKVGASREGIMRNGLMHTDDAVDAVLFSLIPADLEGRSPH